MRAMKVRAMKVRLVELRTVEMRVVEVSADIENDLVGEKMFFSEFER